MDKNHERGNLLVYDLLEEGPLSWAFLLQQGYLNQLRFFLSKAVRSFFISADTYVVHLNSLYLISFMYFIRFNYKSCFAVLTDIVALDTLSGKERFFLCYNYLSTKYNARMVVKVRVPDDDKILSISLIFKNANWLEREAWDLFGIFFVNHPDLRRILTDYGFEAHPLRKDFPLTGYKEIKYSDTNRMITRLNVSLAQEYRSYYFNNPWRSSSFMQ